MKAGPILLVESRSREAGRLKRAFQEAQIVNEVYRVRNAAEARNYLTGKGRFAERRAYPLPCLILVELRLPRQEAFELLAWVRAQAALQLIPVAVLAASKAQYELKRAYDLGAAAYLLKPVRFEDLVATLRQLRMHWVLMAGNPGPPP